MKRLDVIFLSYDEPNADANFRRLQAFAPGAKRVHGVRGIFEAYQAAVDLAASDYLFVVEADNWMLNGFEFVPPDISGPFDICYWRTINPVNGLLSYYGSLKLMRREALTISGGGDRAAVDFFMTLGMRVELQEKPAAETRFNSSPFAAWKGAFRECAKLAGGIMGDGPGAKGQLRAWQMLGANKPFGNWCLLGARMGAVFGAEHYRALALRQINDTNWLRTQFEECLAQAKAPASGEL